tara:strand:+ start:863 stop:1327 length:465 start_codon:yes stop_codon:yes gene_type:complete
MQNSEETVLNDISEKLLRVNLNENVDSRLKKLALSGLIDDGDYSKFMRLMKLLNEEKPIPPDLRKMVSKLFEKLVGYLTKDKVILASLMKNMRDTKRKKVREDKEYFSSQTIAFKRKYKIFEHEGESYFINEEEKMVKFDDDAVNKFIESKRSK